MSAGPARRLALLFVLTMAVASAGVAAAPAPVAAWDPGDPDAASEDLLTGLTNRSRADDGLAALQVDSDLVSLARWRSEDMAVRDYFSHDIPGGTKVFDELSDRGYCYVVAGENIGWLSGPDGGAEQRIHEMFLDSPKHRALILGMAWDAIGIGSYKRADGRHYWTVLFADTCPPEPAVPAVPASAAPALLVSLLLDLARLMPSA
jgi:uncharacterized protein YkwD